MKKAISTRHKEQEQEQEMKEGNDGFVRADQIDLKTIDEQLERHLNKVLTIEKNKQKQGGEEEEEQQQQDVVAVATATKLKSVVSSSFKKQRQEWEIDPSNLIIKGVIARGTFGTVHRGVYDGQDVAVKMLDYGEEGQRTDAEIAALRSAFTQEVAVWHKLDHPNVTKVNFISSQLILLLLVELVSCYNSISSAAVLRRVLKVFRSYSSFKDFVYYIKSGKLENSNF
ncbi:hypothetical protein Ahy_A05g022407 isoform E [Arachis hypogaea]|uniref:Protein kinase domain-containing protein n=1 Tax=Arachis hypogaea TaxID=3818 RepID=A0A445D0N8_ARAHY|nr:hypothetical protein Ahy_A05g022407 isoform E [Arachis hypogaea]